MVDFDLTQTDQQVQNILNDAQGAMGASAQTTLTTEYVMLKDTSGVYHKILKSSFTEAIRDVLAGLLVNNDKGTTINQIAAIASGDFGSITPANLASVLGDVMNHISYIEENNITDMNSYDVPLGFNMIFVAASSQVFNLPDGFEDKIRFMLEYYNYSFDRLQRVTARGSNKTYQRNGKGTTIGSTTWTEWREL